jgi:hypothetical protein
VKVFLIILSIFLLACVVVAAQDEEGENVRFRHKVIVTVTPLSPTVAETAGEIAASIRKGFAWVGSGIITVGREGWRVARQLGSEFL